MSDSLGATDQFASLEQQRYRDDIAELRKDKARLDWLQSQQVHGIDYGVFGWIDTCGKDIRARIDAAMEGK